MTDPKIESEFDRRLNYLLDECDQAKNFITSHSVINGDLSHINIIDMNSSLNVEKNT